MFFFLQYNTLGVAMTLCIAPFCLPSLDVEIIYFAVWPSMIFPSISVVITYRCLYPPRLSFTPYHILMRGAKIVKFSTSPSLIILIILWYYFVHHRCCDFLCVLMSYFIIWLIFICLPGCSCWSACHDYGSLGLGPLHVWSACDTYHLFLLQSVAGGFWIFVLCLILTVSFFFLFVF